MENGVWGKVAAHIHCHQSVPTGNSTMKLVLPLYSKSKQSKQLGVMGWYKKKKEIPYLGNMKNKGIRYNNMSTKKAFKTTNTLKFYIYAFSSEKKKNLTHWSSSTSSGCSIKSTARAMNIMFTSISTIHQLV